LSVGEECANRRRNLEPMMHLNSHYVKMYVYAILGAGVIGVGSSLGLNLDKSLVLPFFPDVLDSLTIIAVGALLLYEVVRQIA
jgi:sulfite exporter TauE/SafE